MSESRAAKNDATLHKRITPYIREKVPEPLEINQFLPTCPIGLSGTIYDPKIWVKLWRATRGSHEGKDGPVLPLSLYAWKIQLPRLVCSPSTEQSNKKRACRPETFLHEGNKWAGEEKEIYGWKTDGVHVKERERGNSSVAGINGDVREKGNRWYGWKKIHFGMQVKTFSWLKSWPT